MANNFFRNRYNKYEGFINQNKGKSYENLKGRIIYKKGSENYVSRSSER